LGFYSLLAGLVTGRLWYVILNWSAYRNELWQAFTPTLNAMSIPALVVGLIGAVLIYSRRHQLNLAQWGDLVAPGLAVGLFISTLGAFLGSRRLGQLSDVPWAISQLGDPRHPVFGYLLILMGLTLFITWRNRQGTRWPGFNFLRLIALYASSWLLLEPFFAWSETTANGLRLTQVVALSLTLLTLGTMAYVDWKRHQPTTNPPITHPTPPNGSKN
jgi:phosphatidylglycerol:prolipoprotein diacylglycerol transferase